MMRNYKLALMLGGATLLTVSAGAASPTCTAPARLIQFPTGVPVWEFCLLTPSQSSGNDGSGIEIRDAYYNGRKVFKRAHTPILNVKYVAGASCDCYRDWIDEERKFEVVTATSNPNPYNGTGPGDFQEAIQPVKTVCSNGGSHGDVPASGSGLRGVAAQRLGDRIILTSQLAAGWYRYFIDWTFYTDGRIEPRFGFGAVNSTCVSNDHRHHAYWRFDFDIDDAANDAIKNVNIEGMKNIGTDRAAMVYDTVSSRGYRVVPGAEAVNSPVGGAPSGGGPFWNATQYPFDVTDQFFLNYKESGTPGIPAEVNDNVGLNQCAITSTFMNFMNSEALNDNGDVVLWYRGGGFHSGGQLDACTKVGPILQPVGDWAP